LRLIPYFWGMHLCQKRPNTEAKETYWHWHTCDAFLREKSVAMLLRRDFLQVGFILRPY
jgi:hypothetical protein